MRQLHAGAQRYLPQMRHLRRHQRLQLTPRRGKMRAPLALLIAGLVLTGCATEAQRHAQEISKAAQAALAQMRSCQSALEANPRYARVYEKLGVSTAREPGRAPTPAQLSDREIVSDDEKSLGFEWYAEGQNCIASAIEALARIDPEFEIYFADRLTELTDVLNDIATHRQTHGEVNAIIESQKQRDRVAAAEFAHNL